MYATIHILPDNIANQIAAGEVIQRPAAVVKELLENAIDAQAKKIQLFIEDAGKNIIQVIDNGIGMSAIDAQMCFEKHATSKIKTTKDLLHTYSMGFRGEALASIAAIAQVTLKTRIATEEIGIKIQIANNKIHTHEPHTTTVGTNISVKNLFFNIPTRRNFLKSNTVETRYIIETFQRIALSRPDIQFTYYQNNKEIYQLPSTKLSHRIIHLLGKEYQKQLIPCQENTDYVKIQGYIGRPQGAKKTRGEQFFFVNKRFIKNHYLHHAVKNAFEGLIAQEAFPFYVLCLEIDPKHIDFNIHPTKIDIQFDNEKMIYNTLKACIKKALAIHNILPSIDFEQSVNFNAFQPNSTHTRDTLGEKMQNYTQFKNQPSSEKKGDHWCQFLEKFHQITDHAIQDHTLVVEEAQTEMVTLTSKANNQNTKKNSLEENISAQNFLQINHQYIIGRTTKGLLLIDQIAAHERILYEKYLQQIQKKKATQSCLYEEPIVLNTIDENILQEIQEDMIALGFQINKQDQTWIVSGYPVDWEASSIQSVIETMIEQYKEGIYHNAWDRQKKIAQTLAKKNKIKQGKSLTPKEMQTLYNTLQHTPHQHYALNGKKIFKEVSSQQLQTILQTETY